MEFSHYEAVCVEGGIDVNWTTVSEVDTLAFLIMRGATASGPFVQVGRVYSSGGGSSYTFHDTAPVPGIFNWYYIEEVVGTAGPPSVTPVFTTDTLCSIPTTCGGVADPPCPPGYVCFCSGQGGNEVCGCIPGGGNIP